MIDKAIKDEIELNKQELESLTYDEKEDCIDCLSALLDLVILCNEEREYKYAYELAEYCRIKTRELCEYTSATPFNELNDIAVSISGFKDPAYDLYWRFVLEQTFYNFESFMWYMEKNRIFVKKFYEPRMYTVSGKPSLKLVADALQEFSQRLYKFLGISLPSRTGKSTICIFFLCFTANQNPNSHSAMGGHAGTLVKGFYKELLNFMTSPEYTFNEIYDRWHPAKTMIQDKSAEDYTITLDEPDRFATVTCRGIDASWTGAIDVSWDGILYVDDLVRDRQHSLSPVRMEETYQEYLNKMVDRKSGYDPHDGTFAGSRELMVGTLWNVLDPLERLRKKYEGDPLYKFLRIPALDDNDESNFDYAINGFTTEYYRNMRSSLDAPEWQAKYQQKPYAREGLLFASDELKYFKGLIKIADIKRVFSVTDPAVGGGDNVSNPICYEMNDGSRKICKWIYDKRSVAFTVPRVIAAMTEHQQTEMRIERNGVGALYVDKVFEKMKADNVIGCKVIPVSAPNKMSKEDKIKGYSDAVKNNFEFLELDSVKPAEIPEGYLWFERDADYQAAMDDLNMYTSEGKNVHDDSADSMAQLAIMCEKKRNGQVEVLHIPEGFGI